MRLKFRSPLRHPLFPDWKVTPVRMAEGRCSVISGSFWELMGAAASGIIPTRAVLVLLYPASPELKDTEREALWQTYQVPILACLLDGDGRLVGYECEAQDGLHVDTTAPAESLVGEDSILGYRLPLDQAVVERTPCDCGRPGVRLRFLLKKKAPIRAGAELVLVKPRIMAG